ncbi:MAG: AAA family ATPase [Halieaceae bacterium]|nr:AAA family ATPase [Halieaceae bacterium]
MVDHDDDGRDRDALAAFYDHWGVAYVAYTTASNMVAKRDKPALPRWRVVLPLSRSLGVAEWLPLQTAMTAVAGGDRAAARIQQGFYAPCLIGSTPYESIDRSDRPALDPGDTQHPLIAALHAELAKPDPEETAKAAPAKPRSLLPDSGGIFDKIRAHYRIADLLEAADYQRKGRAYVAPDSSTGTPGVYLLRDGEAERVYSHHGEHDPLSHLHHDGHALDAFDVLVALEYNGDAHRALREEAAKVDPEGQKQRRREYMAAQEAEPQDETDDAPALVRVDLRSEWDTPVEPTQWVIEGLVPAGTLTTLDADGGTGKSTLALAWCAHVAAGRPWGEILVRHGRALFLSLEDPADLCRKRLKLGCIDYGLPGSAVLENFTLLDGTDTLGALAVPGASRQSAPILTPLFHEFAQCVQGHALAVIDNRSDAYADDEIARYQVRYFTRALIRVAHDAGAAVLLLGHVDKSTARGNVSGASYSGSTAWNNGPRSRIAMLRTEGGATVLKHEKCNVAPRHDDIPITFSGYGIPMPDTSAPEPDAAPDAVTLLDAFRAAHEAGEPVSAGLANNQYCAQATLRRFQEYPEYFKRGRRGHEAAAAAILDLKRGGRIVEESYRDPRQRKWRTRLVLAEHAEPLAESAPCPHDETPEKDDQEGEKCAEETAESAP